MHRRQFLQAGSAVAAALATGTLAACGSDDEATGDTAAPEPDDTTAETTAETTADTEATEETAPETAEAAPAVGGTVRVGLLPSPADVLDPANTAGWMEYSALFSILDSLALLKGDEFEFQLAESIEPNEDATEYTIVLREGPMFHDGTPVTSADVIYSLNMYALSPNFGQFFALIDFANVSAPDDRTVIVPMVSPRADLVESVFGQLSMVVPDGFTDWGNNIGSGPFILEQFEQGVGVTVVRNPDYWAGAPSIERIEFIGIAEGSTRARALESGEVDFAGSLDAAAAATLESADGVTVFRGGEVNSTIRCFAFNRSQAPFDDPTVVEACKLACDRQQLIDVIAFGNAIIGNDMPSSGFEGYPADVPQRERDVARATELFAAAGVTEFTILAADFVPGVVASAELYAQQLAECGVTATVDVGDPLTYFNDFGQILSTPCQAFYFINRPPETLLASYTGSSAAFNVFGSFDPEYDAALNAALATPDTTSRKEQLSDLMATTVRDEEGWLIWAFEDQIDARVDGLEGVDLTQSVPVFGTATLA